MRQPRSLPNACWPLKGIGPWTVDYALLRGFARLDGSLHGDAAVRRQLQRACFGAEENSHSRSCARLAATRTLARAGGGPSLGAAVADRR